MRLAGAALAIGLLAATSAGAEAPTAKAGPITHALTGYKVVREIPAAWTIAKFKTIAKPDPAPAGQVWYVLFGTVTNGSAERRTLNSTTLRLRDQQGRVYKPDVRKTLYQPEGTGVAALDVPASESRNWVAFFAVAADATGVVFHGDDLTFAAKNVARLRIPDPAAGLADAPAPQPAAPARPAAAETPAAAPRAGAGQQPRAGSPPVQSSTQFFTDFNSLKGAALMRKYNDGVIVSGRVLRTLTEMDKSLHVWLDAGDGRHVTLNFKDRGAAVAGVKKGDELQARCDVAGGTDKYIMVTRCELQ